ncbi:WhiB family transcriptional regulator [Kineococcus arenarius]|uniref:WhiB family transcriptional regulator n=1 Tax=unclassified Kineococcus TaxID=2621656 RepID=UPI003D7EB238
MPCRTAPADLFFAEEREQVQRAKALCGACPVRELCLAGALERREPAGVWGGQLFLDGVPVAYKRGRGRPRKDAPPVAVLL